MFKNTGRLCVVLVGVLLLALVTLAVTFPTGSPEHRRGAELPDDALGPHSLSPDHPSAQEFAEVQRDREHLRALASLLLGLLVGAATGWQVSKPHFVISQPTPIANKEAPGKRFHAPSLCTMKEIVSCSK